MSSAKGSELQLSLRILIYPAELVTGGLTQIKECVLHEMTHGAGAEMGAGNTFIWLGLVPALRFEQPKLLGVTGIFRNQFAAQPTDTKNFDPLPVALCAGEPCQNGWGETSRIR